MTTVTVFGGSGFLGQRLVRRLASDGTAVRVVGRHPDYARSTLRAAGIERLKFFCGSASRSKPEQRNLQSAAHWCRCETRSRLTSHGWAATQQFDVRPVTAVPGCRFEFAKKFLCWSCGFFEC